MSSFESDCESKKKIKLLDQYLEKGFVEKPSDDRSNESFESLIEQYMPGDDHQKLQDDLDQLYKSSAKSKKVKSSPQYYHINLHNMTRKQASAEIYDQINNLLQQRSSSDHLNIKIITGRGRHSDKNTGPVLAQHIHGFIIEQFRERIVYIQECPSNTMINNTFLRGYFFVVIAKKPETDSKKTTIK